MIINLGVIISFNFRDTNMRYETHKFIIIIVRIYCSNKKFNDKYYEIKLKYVSLFPYYSDWYTKIDFY